MTNIRRYWNHGKTAFLTHVTHQRLPLLIEHIDLLMPALRSNFKPPAFDLFAWVVLPDHVHLLVDYGESDLSLAVRRFKLSFSTSLRHRLRMKTGRIWQNRFWDHLIRDEGDLQQHLDYIHYNPVRHELARNPHLYKYSTLSRFVSEGYYQLDWGVVDRPTINGEFGE
jgi:putative transposase